MREMLAHGCSVGGENSGHFIFSEVSPCGDGLAAALALLSVMADRGGKLSELRGGISMYPQVSKAVKVARKIADCGDCKPLEGNRDARSALGKEGRLLVRYSGTEKKIRLLVEGKDAAKIGDCMKILEKRLK